MLMPMRRTGFAFVLLIAAAIACEPLIHTHAVTQTSHSPCAVCVGFVAHDGSVAHVTIAPPVVVGAVTPLVTAPAVSDAYTSLASRAPPAA